MGVVCFNCLKCSVYIRRIGLVLLNRRILLLLSKMWNVWCSFRAHSIIIISMSSISTVYFLSYFIDVDDFFSEWFIFICLIYENWNVIQELFCHRQICKDSFRENAIAKRLSENVMQIYWKIFAVSIVW